MRNDKRRSLRRRIRYTAWLVVGPGERRDGLLSDISETGARIDIDDPKEVPDRFLLWLSVNGTARRHCQVVWREAHQIGVKFERRLAETDRASLVPTRGTVPHTQTAASTEAAASE